MILIGRIIGEFLSNFFTRLENVTVGASFVYSNHVVILFLRGMSPDKTRTFRGELFDSFFARFSRRNKALVHVRIPAAITRYASRGGASNVT